jgi:hypothetical protein
LKTTEKYSDKFLNPYPSEESKIPCSTDFKALAAVAAIHTMNPNKWKLGSPYDQIEEEKHIRSQSVFICHKSISIYQSKFSDIVNRYYSKPL